MLPAVPVPDRQTCGGIATLGRRSRRHYRRHNGGQEPAAVIHHDLKAGDNDDHDSKPPVRKVSGRISVLRDQG